MAMFSYIDEDGRLRGPFGDVQMHYWYLQGYLQPSLKIFVHHGLFGRPTTLEELVKTNGTLNPFTNEVENVELEHISSPKPTTSCTNTFYPFLTGFASERVNEEKLDERSVEECFCKLQLVKDRYTLKYMNGVLRKFGADEKQECILCGKVYYGILMLQHCLSEPHIDQVYKRGRFFSHRDKAMLYEMLDSMIRGAKESDFYTKTSNNEEVVPPSVEENISEEPLRKAKTLPSSSPSDDKDRHCECRYVMSIVDKENVATRSVKVQAAPGSSLSMSAVRRATLCLGRDSKSASTVYTPTRRAHSDASVEGIPFITEFIEQEKLKNNIHSRVSYDRYVSKSNAKNPSNCSIM